VELVVHEAFTEKFSVGVQGEDFNDKAGTRTGTPQDFWEITLTAGYRWVKSFETRLKYRLNQSNARSFDRNGRAVKNQETTATEFISCPHCSAKVVRAK
jgi:hypothetical protein